MKTKLIWNYKLRKELLSPRHFLIAAVCGTAGLLCYIYFSLPVAILYFVVFVILLCITLINVATQEIPDSLNLALLLCGTAAAIWNLTDTDILSRVIGLFAVSLPLLIISLAMRGAFGMGDVKLMFAAGFLLGWTNVLIAFFLALILGGAYAAIVLVT
jgi:leader peptidase (prepilin peptidase)/N-methyltransferase